MIPLSDVFQSLFQTFDGSAVKDFRAFLQANPGIDKWIIAADFCLADKDKANSVFAFTLIPYDALLDDMQREIREALPKDLKKTQEINPGGIELLKNSRRFNLAFIFAEHPDLFPFPDRTSRLEAARQSLDLAVQQLTCHGRTKEQLKRLRGLKQRSQAKSFNIDLLSDLILLAQLFCFVTLIVLRERPCELVGWFPDRDCMTTWEDGAVWDIALESLAGLSEHFSIPQPVQPIAVGTAPDINVSALWFDDLIRLPDYIAGLFASWDLKLNAIDGKPKYKQLTTGVAATAKNLVAINVRYGQTFQAGRLVFAPAEAPCT
jgi:hypothetical protein